VLCPKRKPLLPPYLKEIRMLYKTMVLELIEQRPQMHAQLKHQHKLLLALELYANELKTRHDAWKEMLWQANPESSERQIATEALERALKELEAALPSVSLPEESDTLSLDGAMAFICRHTPPA
jgi:hypothetical protein